MSDTLSMSKEQKVLKMLSREETALLIFEAETVCLRR